MGKNRKRPQFTPEEKLCPALLAESSDRGLVLVGHSFLDYELGQMLKRFFESRLCGDSAGTLDKGDEERVDRLLFGSPPDTEAIAGSYSVRVTLLQVLGLIDRETCSALRALNGLRILCAHSPTVFSLTNARVGEMVAKLPQESQQRVIENRVFERATIKPASWGPAQVDMYGVILALFTKLIKVQLTHRIHSFQ